jgi:colicin import membrane protein
MNAATFPHGNAGYDVKLGGPIVFAIGLHLLLALLLWVSSRFTWNHEVTSAAGSTMEATTQTTAAEDRAVMQAMNASKPSPVVPQPIVEETTPPPQPIPETRPQDSLAPQQTQAQEVIPMPDKINQDEVRSDAISPDKGLKEQDEKRKQAQVDLTEEIKRQKDAQEKQRLAQQQADEQAKRDAEKQKKLDEIRSQMKQAQREVQLAQQKQQQLADAMTRNATASASTNAPATATSSATVGQGGTDEGLNAKYIAAIQAAVLKQWTRPDSVALGTKCTIIIKQIPGGEVIGAQVQPGCVMDRAGQDSLERAVLKAQPLPYRGFESVFNRQLNFNFTAQDH